MSEPNGVKWDHAAFSKPTIIDPDAAVIDVSPRRTKVAIMGFATATRDLAPFNDPEWEIWGLNQLYRHIPREDRHFDIHVNWNEHVVEGTDHAGWIKSAPIPTYMAQRIPDLGEKSVRYPIERVLACTGIDYFTSTVAYMIALAMTEGFTTIGLFGIDLIVGPEYIDQKPCVEFLLGMAHARNIHVMIPTGSALLRQSHRYGYELAPQQHPVSLDEIREKIAAHRVNRETQMKLLYLHDGAIQALEHFEQLAELRIRGGNPRRSS